MTIRMYPVAVKQLPETLNGNQGRLFLRELKSSMITDRPGIVLDCSKLCQLDKGAVLVLLGCLEAAIKRNGDIKLAAVPVGARALLKLTRADRVFEMFDTNEEAAGSFGRLWAPAFSPLSQSGDSLRTLDHVA